MVNNYLPALESIKTIRKEVSAISPALERCYPVAIVDGGSILVYDVNPTDCEYRFIKQASLNMAVPSGIRAAFQLEELGGRIACVITPDVFDSIEGYVTIFHEFVHCYQFETCEETLKNQLDIAQKAREVGDHMWEIEHPFPYTSRNFVDGYKRFMDAVQDADQKRIKEARKSLRAYLGVHDYEYMVWQEWKEGFARWVENCVREHLGLPQNDKGKQTPYSRVSFYVGGAAFIELLAKDQPCLVENLSSLFSRIYISAMDENVDLAG